MDECEEKVLRDRSAKLAVIEKDLKSFIRYVNKDYPLFNDKFNRHARRLAANIGVKLDRRYAGK